MSGSAHAHAAGLPSLLAGDARLLVLAELARRGEGGATLADLSDTFTVGSRP